MSQCLSELCNLLVEDTLGAFFAHIFSALTRYGRLEAAHLAQKCRLPLRQIRHGLSVLVQAQLVYHYTSSDQRTSYEANLRAAYDLVRSGKIIHHAKEILGEDAALFLAHILSAGQVKMKDLDSFWIQSQGDYGLQNGGSNQGDETINGHPTEIAEFPPHSRTEVQHSRGDPSNVLKSLVKNGFVTRLRRSHFHTAVDNFYDAQSQLLSLDDSGAVKARKGQDALGEQVLEEMANRNDSTISLADVIYGNKTSLKRSAADGSDSAIKKKIKLTNGASSASRSIASNVAARHAPDAETFVIHVNHDKVVAMLRNRRLVDKARRTLGRSAAHAYIAILQQSTSVPRRWQRRSELAPEDEDFDANSHLIDQDSLLMALNTQDQHDDDEDSALPPHIRVNGCVNGNHSTEAGQTAVTMNETKAHLCILAQPPHQFVVQDPDSFRWTVDFRQLSSQLRREEAMRLAKSRLNGVALRLVRVLLDSGKLDEKTLQEKSLLSAKDLRQCLAKLKKSGFVSLQEVPKEPQRQPLRTIYLWFYDSDRVRKMLLGDLYKAMTRLLRRLKMERDRVGALLEKAERTDVRGKEDRFLARGEIEVLDSWKRKEERLLGEVERLDDSVAILRDI